MSLNVQDVADTLFPTPETGILNIKFFRGTCSEVTADQLAEQASSANSQIEQGTARVIHDIDAPRKITI